MKNRLTVDGSYNYIEQTGAQSRMRRCIYSVIRTVFPPALKLVYGFRIIENEKRDEIEGGFVTVYNHVHSLDCVMMGCAAPNRRLFYITLKRSCELPVVGRLIRLLGAMPLPDDDGGRENLKRACAEALEQGGVLQICPEGSLVPDYTTLRPFKLGAFAFAVHGGVPVSPCVIRKYDAERLLVSKNIELVVLDPIYPDTELPEQERIQDMCRRARAEMTAALQRPENEPVMPEDEPETVL